MNNVVVIGGGIGGLATSLRLLSKGFKVTLIEKEEQLGGKINTFTKNGYKFDLTCSLLMTPQIYKNTFIESKLDYEEYFTLNKLDTLYRVFYEDNTRHDFFADIEKSMITVDKISKRNTKGYKDFIEASVKKYNISEKYFLKVNMDKLKNLCSFRNIAPGLRLAPLSTSEEFVRKYIDSEKLINYLLFQSMYVGVSPYNSTNLYTLVPGITQEYGLWYINGGMYSYIKALKNAILDYGGEIITGTEVKEIIIEKNRVKSVRTRKNEYKCDIVVCNADFPYAVTNLIKNDKHKDGYDVQKIKKLKYSCSVFMLYLGTNKKYRDLKIHNIFIGDEFRHNMEVPFRGKMPSNPPMYIYCPSRIDAGMAREDGEVINVMVRVPNLLSSNINWNGEMIKNVRNKIMRKLKEIEGLEDIEEHIVTEEYLTPLDFEEQFNSYGGAAFGIGHNLSQTTYFRPHIKSKSVEGLYYVGGSIHPGVGASVVLLGAGVVSDTIMSDLAKIKKK